jgi:hypothetical protein
MADWENIGRLCERSQASLAIEKGPAELFERLQTLAAVISRLTLDSKLQAVLPER